MLRTEFVTHWPCILFQDADAVHLLAMSAADKRDAIDSVTNFEIREPLVWSKRQITLVACQKRIALFSASTIDRDTAQAPWRVLTGV